MSEFISIKEYIDNPPENKTPDSLKRLSRIQLKAYCKDFTVEKAASLKRVEELRGSEKDSRFIIVSSHFSDQDVHAAAEALGDNFNILITGESLVLDSPPGKAYKKLAGEENFASLDYKEQGQNKRGIFNPQNFENIEKQMQTGKTPWIAGHPFSNESHLENFKTGPIYLAHKTNSYLIPTALEIVGGKNVKFNSSPFAPIKQIANRLAIKYHVGEPIKFPQVDVGIIEKVMSKRNSNLNITEEEKQQFKEVTKILKEQAEELGKIIANMLPENQRGKY